MSAPPLLSIGVPVYNGERYLAEALESALGQAYPNLEVLISDNASTDSTREVCRRFETDPRVQYSRSAETIDPISNFRRVLGMARGEYFTWLAHDDVLTSPGYASTLVETLETDPETILSASSLELIRDDGAGEPSFLSYPRLANDRPWAVARRALFRWPPGEWETLIYGVFRREALQRHLSENPSLRFPLQKLAFAGRFSVVPSALRGYRLHEDSLARRRVAKSDAEVFLMGVALKWRLLWTAARAPTPLRQRIAPLGTACGNLFRDHVGWAHTVRGQIRAQEKELAMLAAVAKEREALIRRNGGQPPRPPIEPLRRHRRWSAGWFRRPSPADTSYLEELIARVAEGRRTCDALLAAIERSAALDG